MRMSGSALRSCGWPAPAAVIWTRRRLDPLLFGPIVVWTHCCLNELLFERIVVWTNCCLETDRPCAPQSQESRLAPILLRLTSLSALLPR